MRILLVNNFHYLRGGDCAYTMALASLLRSRGIDVHHFAMHHPENQPAPDEQFFVPHIDYRVLNGKQSIRNGVKVLRRSIFSREARQSVAHLLDAFSFDIVHLQNIHAYLTPSILFEFERRRIPVVWTLHDFKLVCPDSRLFSRGATCTACRGANFFMCLAKRCKKDSLGASTVATLEAYTHKLFRVPDKAALYLAPSQFLIDTFCSLGWARNRFHLLKNFVAVDAEPQGESPDEVYGAFIGQLEVWKGVATLIRAGAASPDVPLVVVGTGTEEERLKVLALHLGASGIRFCGFLAGAELARIRSGAGFIVVPSECYENASLSVLEAMAAAKPVIASRLGGLCELVEDGVTGLLFEPGNADDLAAKIQRLATDADLRRRLGTAARNKVLRQHTAERHLYEVIQIYRRVIEYSRGEHRWI